MWKLNYIEKIIEYSLYVLAFLLPWQTRWIVRAGELNGYWEYGTFSLYATDVLLILVLLCFMVWQFLSRGIKNYELRIKNVWWLIGGLELIVFISIFFADDKLLALYKYGVFLLGVGLFWLITSAKFDKLKLFYSFLGGVFLQACLGIWQFLTQSSFANKWLGMAAHNPGDLGTSVIETLAGGRWLRAYGGLDHPNILGGLLVVGILFCIKLIIKYQVTKKEGINDYELRIKNYVIILTTNFLLLTSVAALFFTFSRGAWAGALVGILTLLIFVIIKKDLVAQISLLKIIVFSSLLVFILFNLFSDLALTRLSQDTRLEVKSSQERVESYTTARDIIERHWLFGAGIGNYTLVVHNEIDNKQPGYFYQPAHNAFLLVCAETGIFGLLLFISIIIFLIFNFKFLIFKQFSIFEFSIIITIITMMMVDHFWWSLHFGVLLFWFLLGLMYREERGE